MKISTLLAYETGVHIGDGNMYCSNNMHRVTYSGNLTNEKMYYKKILFKIIHRIYGIKPLYYERKTDNTVLLIINSKSIVEFKNNTLRLPIGPKTRIKIPLQFWTNKKLLANCLCGIVDTDFSLSFKKDKKGFHKEPRLELFISSKTLYKDIIKALKKFGFTFSKEEKVRNGNNEFRIRIYGKKNLSLWLEEIGFKNPKNIRKLKIWRKFGFIPKKIKSY